MRIKRILFCINKCSLVVNKLSKDYYLYSTKMFDIIGVCLNKYYKCPLKIDKFNVSF